MKGWLENELERKTESANGEQIARVTQPAMSDRSERTSIGRALSDDL
jgi:hypothetical protein